MRKNVLQFIGSFNPGGSERQAVQLIRLLAEEGSKNIFVATLNFEGSLSDEVGGLGLPEVEEYPLETFYDLNFLRQLRRCSAFIKKHEIDIVHTHDFYTNVFGILAARLAKVPLKIASKRETGGVRTSRQERVERWIFKIADKLIVNSEAVRNYAIAGGVNSKRIHLIYNGLDTSRMTSSTSSREAICKKFNLPSGSEIRFVTLVANLRHRVKNQEMLLRAGVKLKDEFPNLHYVLAGEGGRSETLKKIAAESGLEGATHFVGSCDRIADLLSVSDVCVLTSVAEGFSNSILEYMYASKPVVATDVGGVREAIVDGETGFVVESDDDEQLADKLRFLLTNKEIAVHLGAEGRSRVESEFSLENQLRNTLAIYNS